MTILKLLIMTEHSTPCDDKHKRRLMRFLKHTLDEASWDFEMKTAWLLCAALNYFCSEYDEHYRRFRESSSSYFDKEIIRNEDERHIVTVIGMAGFTGYLCCTSTKKDNYSILSPEMAYQLLSGTEEEKNELAKDFYDSTINYEDFSASLNYLMNLGLVTKNKNKLIVDDDFKQWFMFTYAGIGTFMSANARRLLEIFGGVQVYINDVKKQKAYNGDSFAENTKNDYITKQEYEAALDDILNNTFFCPIMP